MRIGRVVSVICMCAMTVLIASEHCWSEAPKRASEIHRITIHVERVDSLHLEALVELTNEASIAALTLPLQWGNGRSVYRLDSADYQGLRTEYFALKTFRIDSTKQSVLIGLISDLGGNYPPLEPGSGGIARLHFSSKRPANTALAIDTTFFPPHNTLQLVTPDVRAIRPSFQSSMRSAP